MKNINRYTLPNTKGFTLIELLVASVLALIVIAAAGSTYFVTRKLNTSSQKRLEVQQELRNSASMITRDARNAGAFGCYSTANAASNFQFFDETSVSQRLINITDTKGARNVYDGYGVRKLTSLSELSNAGFTTTGLSAFKGGILLIYGKDTSGITFSQSSFSIDATALPSLHQTIMQEGDVVVSSCSNAYSVKVSNPSRNTNGSSFTLQGFDGGKIGYPSLGEVTISKLYAAAYIVATINNTPSLLRYDLDESGKWQGPQLLMQNVDDMTSQFIYVQNCGNRSRDKSKHNKETFKFLDDLVDNDTEKALPAGIRLNIKYTYPNSTTKDSYIINATIRSGNTCSNVTPANK